MSSLKKQSGNAVLRSQCRLWLDNEIAFGPGKADLLAAIAETGSISAAGKKLGMSYRRAWLLVDTMNRCFQQPLVDTAKGGSHGGGTRLTACGEAMLSHYRELQMEISVITEKYFQHFKPLLRKKPIE